MDTRASEATGEDERRSAPDHGGV